eukprot:gene1028-1066_t
MAAETADTKCRNACQLLSEALQQDEDSLLLDRHLSPSSGTVEYDRCYRKLFETSQAGRMPDLLQGHQFNPMHNLDGSNAQATPPFRDGVLPEIGRYWRSFNNTIFLWNVLGASDDVVQYSVDSEILAVTIVTPKPFVKDVDYFLVIATRFDVSLHEIVIQRGDRILPLTKTDFRIELETAPSAVVGDDSSGRVFIGTVDGAVWEFEYHPPAPAGAFLSLFTSKRKKANRGVVRRASILPMGLRKVSTYLFGEEGRVLQMVFDSDRRLIRGHSAGNYPSGNLIRYVLHDKPHVIRVFFVPNAQPGETSAPDIEACCEMHHDVLTRQVNSKSLTFSSLARPSPTFNSTVNKNKPVRIVNLHLVSPYEATSIVLMGVTDRGCRVYFRLHGVAFDYISWNPVPAAPTTSTAPRPPGAPIPPTSSSTNPMQQRSTLPDFSQSLLPPGGRQSLNTDQNPDVVDTRACTRGREGLKPGARMPTGIDIFAVRPCDPELGEVKVSSSAGGANLSMMSAKQRTADGSSNNVSNNNSNQGSKVLAIAIDTRVTAHRQVAKMQGSSLTLSSALHETLEILPVDDNVRYLIELPPKSFVNSDLLGLALPSPPYKNAVDPAVPTNWLSELANQTLMPSKQFVAITDGGAILMSRVTPVNVLQSHLKENHVQIQPLRDFVAQYTTSQTSAMLFQMLSTAASVQAARKDVRDHIGKGHLPAASGNNNNSNRGLMPSMPAFSRAPNRRPFNANAMISPNRIGLAGRLPPAPGTSARQSIARAIMPGAGNNPFPGIGSSQSEQAPDESLYRVQQLLLTHQYANALGILTPFSQGGHITFMQRQNQPAGANLTPRCVGFVMFLSRILRPIWLYPVLVRRRVDDNTLPESKLSKKRPRTAAVSISEDDRLGDGVLPERLCVNWTAVQRTFLREQLQGIHAMLEKSANALAPTSGPAANEIPPLELQLWRELAMLVLTAFEGIGFLSILEENISGDISWEVEKALVSASFGDILFDFATRNIVKRALRPGVGPMLHARCPHLFSQAEAEVITAMEHLAKIADKLRSPPPANNTVADPLVNGQKSSSGSSAFNSFFGFGGNSNSNQKTTDAKMLVEKTSAGAQDSQFPILQTYEPAPSEKAHFNILAEKSTSVLITYVAHVDVSDAIKKLWLAGCMRGVIDVCMAKAARVEMEPASETLNNSGNNKPGEQPQNSTASSANTNSNGG